MKSQTIDSSNKSTNAPSTLTARLFSIFNYEFEKKPGERKIIIKLNYYSILPFLVILSEIGINLLFRSTFIYTSIIIFFIYYLCAFTKIGSGEFRWDKEKIFYRPVFQAAFGEIGFLLKIIDRQKSIKWDDITEINVVKPAERISIYHGRINLAHDFQLGFGLPDPQRKFARYARWKLRKKPNVVWST